MTPLATTRLTLVTVVSLAVLVVAPSYLHGRMQGLATEPKASAFEVASVKLNTSGDLRATMGVQPGGRFTAINVPRPHDHLVCRHPVAVRATPCERRHWNPRRLRV